MHCHERSVHLNLALWIQIFFGLKFCRATPQVQLLNVLFLANSTPYTMHSRAINEFILYHIRDWITMNDLVYGLPVHMNSASKSNWSIRSELDFHSIGLSAFLLRPVLSCLAAYVYLFGLQRCNVKQSPIFAGVTKQSWPHTSRGFITICTIEWSFIGRTGSTMDSALSKKSITNCKK